MESIEEEEKFISIDFAWILKPKDVNYRFKVGFIWAFREC